MLFCICDDDIRFANTLQIKLEKSLKGTFLEGVGFKLYDNANDLICENIFKEFDVIFMDIEMPNVKGDEAVRYFRTTSSKQIIIYVSSYDQMAFETYDTKPLAFIRKHKLDEDVSRAIKLLKNEILNRDTKIIIKEKNGEVRPVSLKSIYYIETTNHLTKVYIKKEEDIEAVETRSSMRELEKILCEKDFIKTHKSYLVNLENVYSVGRTELTLLGKEKIPVSKHRLEETKKMFDKYLWKVGC